MRRRHGDSTGYFGRALEAFTKPLVEQTGAPARSSLTVLGPWLGASGGLWRPCRPWSQQLCYWRGRGDVRMAVQGSAPHFVSGALFCTTVNCREGLCLAPLPLALR